MSLGSFRQYSDVCKVIVLGVEPAARTADFAAGGVGGEHRARLVCGDDGGVVGGVRRARLHGRSVPDGCDKNPRLLGQAALQGRQGGEPHPQVVIELAPLDAAIGASDTDLREPA